VKFRGVLLALAIALAVQGFHPARAQAANAWTKPGILRVGVLRDIDSIDPLLSGQSASSDIAALVFSGLVRFDDRGNTIPDVALALPTRRNGGISADGKTIVYHLRRGVTFSDGVPLTAEDVAFTWRLIMNPKNNVPYHYPNDRALSVTAADPYTLVVKLKAPSAPFLSYFMRGGIQRAILPKHLLEHEADLNRSSFNLRPVGSGPFVVVKWQPGVELDLAANPRYWRGKPKLSEIRYRIIPNDNTLRAALQSHDIDLWQELPESQYAGVTGLPGISVTLSPTLGFEHVAFNTRRPPLDDVRVRQAIAYAIDWQGLREKIYRGLGDPGMADIPPFSWAYDPAATPYPHDLVRARALLEAAGWTLDADGIRHNGTRRLTLDISSTTGAAERESAEIYIQQNLRDAGIELQVRNYPASMLFGPAGAGGILNNGKYDLSLSTWEKYPDPDDTDSIGPDALPPKGANSTFWADPQVGRWLALAVARYDEAERAPYYRLVQERIRENVPMHTIVWRKSINAFNSDLRGFRPGAGVSVFWNAWELELP
jgi:peptide/nickel transport system substrate-binding protein